jgi:hypothetical protein
MKRRPKTVGAPVACALGLLVASLVFAACGSETSSTVTFPPAESTPAPAGDATAAARAMVIAALGAVGLQGQDAIHPYRPPEAAGFSAAPRSVLQVTLPDDPDHGFIVLYAFGSPTEAEAAASEQAAYIASGPGRVQFGPGSRFVLRLVGATVIFFTWSPDNAPDPRTASIDQALSTVGTAVAIPG